MTKVNSQAPKFILRIYSLDDRKYGVGGFSLFLKRVLNDVDALLGGYFFSNDKDVIRVVLILDCNYSKNESKLLVKSSKKQELSYTYRLDFDRVIAEGFDLKYFGDIVASILKIVFLDAGLDLTTLNKIGSRLDELQIDEKLEYIKYEI